MIAACHHSRDPNRVLHYEFLWSHESEPEKRRPCVILTTETFGGRPGRHIHYVPRRWNHLHYGYLPPALFKIVKDAVLALDASRKKVMKRPG